MGDAACFKRGIFAVCLEGGAFAGSCVGVLDVCFISGTLVVCLDGAFEVCLSSGTLVVCFDGGLCGEGGLFSWSLMRIGIFRLVLRTTKAIQAGAVKPPN